MSKNIVAVLLAGGKGRRLQPFTTTIPKPLFPIGEKPILQIIIEQLKEFNINEFIISLGYLGGLIEAYFGDGRLFNCNIRYIRESEPLGTAGPISILPEMTDDFIFMNGDVFTTINIEDAIQHHTRNNAIMTVCTYNKSVISSLGIIKSDANLNILDYIEKPEINYTVSSGIYILSKEIKQYTNYNERIDLPELVMKLVNKNLKVISFPIVGEWFDIGTHEDLNKAIDFYLKIK